GAGVREARAAEKNRNARGYCGGGELFSQREIHDGACARFGWGKKTMKRICSIGLFSCLFIGASLVLAQESGGEKRLEHTQWIDQVLRSVQSIQPGMTRQQLLGVFTEEGGLSNRLHRLYVLNECPYIKVAVEFEPVGEEENLLIEKPEDRIKEVSRPFLQYSIGD